MSALAFVTLIATDGREHRVPASECSFKGKLVLPAVPESFAGVIARVRFEFADGSFREGGVVGRREVGENV